MSQGGIISITGGSPTIPTSFVTDSGTAVPALNIINVLGTDGVTTTGSGNTVTVKRDDYLSGTATVTGATTGDIITFDLGASAQVYRFTFQVTGRETTSGDGIGYTVDASARTDGASATVIATPFTDADEDTSILGALIDVVASGNNIILRATGVAGTTIDYSAIATYIGV